ncbi:MAG: hypothetical protein ACXVI9_11885 [Mucilaginibacter sp.]
MKNLVLILLCGLLAIVSACSKKGNSNPAAGSIVGRWAVKGDTSREYIAGALASTYVVMGINSPWYQFNANGTGASKFNLGLPDDTIHFTYHVSHDTLYVEHPDEVIRGKDYVAYSYNATIQQLTQHSLIFIDVFGTSPNYIEDVYLSR